MASRTKGKRERDLNTIADLYVQRKSQAEIARILGVSQGTVSNELKRLLKYWQEQRMDDINKVKMEQLHRINKMEEQLWICWENSMKTPKKVVSKSKSGEFPGGVQEEKWWKAGSVEEMPVGGDMQYMHGIQWCVQERNKITGAYAPKKISNTDPTGEYEARSAKEEVLGIIEGIAKKALSPVDDESVIDVEDLSERDPQQMAPLARILQLEQLNRVSADTEKISYDTEGNILVER